jgi:hypothetical protein
MAQDVRPVSRTRGQATSDSGYGFGNDARLLTNEGVPSNGTNGTGAGSAGKGSLISDVTNGKLYINTGTKASPTWTVVGTQS